VQRRLDENPQAMRLKNVRTEMALSVLAYNLTRVMNIFGVRPLIAAIRT
jgi:transposase